MGPAPHRTLRAIAIALLVLAASAAGSAELAVGKPVEPFRIKTLKGGDVTPAGTKGRILVVNLWATWCQPCREELPAIEAFFRKYHARGVDVVAVSLDDRSDVDAVKAALAAYSVPAAMATESDVRAFGRIRHVPATFVIDRDGVLARNGWIEAGRVDFDGLEKVVRPLLGQEAK